MEPSEESDALAHAVVEAALEVHRQLGPAFAESIYENALCLELAARGIGFARQVSVTVVYKGVAVGEGRMDLVVGDRVVVELKAVPALAEVHVAQALSYLKATGRQLALLLNFGERHMKAGIRRLVLTRPS